MILAASWLAAAAFTPAGEGADSLVYELREGSFLLDGCLNCDRAEVKHPLGGTLRLTQTYVGNVIVGFDMGEVDFETLDGNYLVQGSGKYNAWLAAPRPTAQFLSLTLDIAGGLGIQLESTRELTSTPFPAVDVEISEDGQRDPLHVFTIRIVAAPPAVPVLYQVEKGSVLIDQCLPCAARPVEVPLTGGFLLARIDGDYPFAPFPQAAVYRVDRVDLHGALPGLDYRLSGAGTFLIEEEKPGQEVLLELAVNGSPGRHFAGGAQSDPPPAFPALDLRLEEQDPPSQLQVLSLRLIATPAPDGNLLFRRGDANSDRSIDIGDPLAVLFHLFAGGRGVRCEKSADADDSGAIGIADAIRLLQYLFNAGRPPEGPFTACGSDPVPDVLTCEESPGCR